MDASVPSDVGLWGFRDMTGGALSTLSERGHATDSESREACQAGCCSAIHPKPASCSPRGTTATRIGRPEPRPRRSGCGCAQTACLAGSQGLSGACRLTTQGAGGDHPESAPPASPPLGSASTTLGPSRSCCGGWPASPLARLSLSPPSPPPVPLHPRQPGSPFGSPKTVLAGHQAAFLPVQPARIQQAWPKPHKGRARWHTHQLPWLNAPGPSPRTPISSPLCTGPPDQCQGGLRAEAAGPGAGQAAEPGGLPGRQWGLSRCFVPSSPESHSGGVRPPSAEWSGIGEGRGHPALTTAGTCLRLNTGATKMNASHHVPGAVKSLRTQPRAGPRLSSARLPLGRPGRGISQQGSKHT